MYYQGNELYRYLLEHGLSDQYFWVSGNMWTLLYSNSDGTPVTLCFASKVDREEELTQPPTPEEIRAFRQFCLLAKQAQLPLFSLRFVDDGLHACERFLFKEYQGGEPSQVIPSGQLLAWLREHGLQFQGDSTKKDINDASSSSFHIWQREHMGNSVIATDIDLMRMESGRVDTIYELKRSYLPLEKWKPFENDRANYRAGLFLAQRAGAEYRIVYNVRHTKPEFFDDVSRLKIFCLDQGWPADTLGEYAIEDYFPREKGGETT